MIPTGEPSKQPSSEPSGQPTSRPTGEPTTIPSGEPTLQPSSEPSGQPTVVPTSQPTQQPSSNPTLLSPFLFQREEGSNASSHIVWDLNGLGHANSTLPIYMSVAVIPTSYEFEANQWATITVNGHVAVEFCTPKLSCSEDWYYCTHQMPVHDILNTTAGGQLVIDVSVTGVESGPCDYLGYPLYARVELSETFVPPNSPPFRTHVMFIVVPIVVFLLLLLLAFLVDKVLAYHKANDKYKVRQPVDVEAGMENMDPDERATRGSNNSSVPSLQAAPIHKLHRQFTRSNSRHVKVVPIEEDSEPEAEAEPEDDVMIEDIENDSDNTNDHQTPRTSVSEA